MIILELVLFFKFFWVLETTVVALVKNSILEEKGWI